MLRARVIFAFVSLMLAGSLANAAAARTTKRRTGTETTATPVDAPSAASESRCKNSPVSLFGTSLRLATVLDQLARNQGLRLIVRSDVNAKQEVDIPTLKNVCLEEALRVILTPPGYAYDIANGELIVFARYVRVYRVNVPMIQQEYITDLSNEGGQKEGGGGGGGGGGQQGQPGNTGGAASLGARLALKTTSSSIGIWAELENAVKTLLSKDGTYSINHSAGLLSVRDKAYALDAVQRYVEAVNEEMARQVVIEVRVAEVTLNNNLEAGIDWGVVWDGISHATATTSSLSAKSLIESGAAGGSAQPVTFGIQGVNASVVLRALEAQGEVELVSQPNLLVGNNLPAMMQAGKIQAYVSEVTLEATGVGGAIGLSVETGVVSDGLVLSMLPRINEDGTVLIALSVVQQDILAIEPRVFGNGSLVELPTVNRRSYSGVVTGRLDETIIIAGLIEDREEDKTLGVPILSKVPILGILFGGQQYNSRRTELVILLSPRTVDSARPTVEDLERFPDPRE